MAEVHDSAIFDIQKRKRNYFTKLQALVVQGALKDGVTTWIPTYISETYGLSGILSIAGTMIIPVFNLLGVYLASAVNQYRVEKIQNKLFTGEIGR